MIPINDVKEPDAHQTQHILGASQHSFTKIHEKQHGIACLLTYFTHRTHPVGHMMSHPPLHIWAHPHDQSLQMFY